MDTYWQAKYEKYKNKYLLFKNIVTNYIFQTGGRELTAEENEKVEHLLAYAKSFIGVPYRWFHTGEKVIGTDKFYADNGPSISREEIDSKNLCVVCTGLTNLMRREAELKIPGTKDLPFSDTDIIKWNDDEGKEQIFSWKEEGLEYAGTTGIWFHYLDINKKLEEFNEEKNYPKGTMLIANYIDIASQGHVAVVVSEGKTIKDQDIIHATSFSKYSETKDDVGKVVIQNFCEVIEENWFHVTHVCLPENWLLTE